MKYDMRSSRPLVTYDQRNDYPIHSVYYNTELECVVSADKRNVKLWDINTVRIFRVIKVEMHAMINLFCY